MTATFINWVLTFVYWVGDWMLTALGSFIDATVGALGITSALPAPVVNVIVAFLCLLDTFIPWPIAATCIGVIMATIIGEYLISWVIGLTKWLIGIVVKFASPIGGLISSFLSWI